MASRQLCFVFYVLYQSIYCASTGNAESDGLKHLTDESAHDNSEESVVSNYRLEIQPESPVVGFPLIKRVGENLTLSCRVIKEGGPFTKFTLEWHVPLHANNRINMQKPDKLGARQLAIKNLQESDSGYYHCMARNEDKIMLNQSISVQVKPRKGSCGEGMFLCSSKACIPRRYLCDGFNDCPDGTDESIHTCGESPCDGKLHCDDGRCISPQYCCDRFRDPTCNVSVQIPCCLRFFPSFNEIDLSLHNQQLSDIGFLQSTMYTIIGCAVAFVLIITFTVLAICRVHMRRSGLTATYASYRENGRTWNDLDSYLAATSRWNRNLYTSSRARGLDVTLGGGGGGVSINDPASNTLLVTYNINNGVQIVGRPVNPPAYETIAQAPPQREEPPPPYTSHENLAAAGRVWTSLGPHSALSTLVALLSGGGGGSGAEDRGADLNDGQLDENHHNNNGDINGNSTQAVRVQPNSNAPGGDAVSSIHLPPSSQP